MTVIIASRITNIQERAILHSYIFSCATREIKLTDESEARTRNCKTQDRASIRQADTIKQDLCKG